MATARVKGYLFVAQPVANPQASASADNESALLYTNNGIEGTDQFPITGLYIWECNTEMVFQFAVLITSSNVRQRNWRTITGGASGGPACGAFEVQLGSSGVTGKYLVCPERAFGWFDGVDTLNIQVTCKRARFTPP